MRGIPLSSAIRTIPRVADSTALSWALVLQVRCVPRLKAVSSSSDHKDRALNATEPNA